MPRSCRRPSERTAGRPCCGLAPRIGIPGRFNKGTRAERPPCGLRRLARRWRSALATARFAIRKASSASGSPASVAIARSIRPAATPAAASNPSAVWRRSSAIALGHCLGFKHLIQSRYLLTSGKSAPSRRLRPRGHQAPPSGARPRRRPTVSVCSTSAVGIHRVRS